MLNDGSALYVDGKMWIPSSAKDLLKRILIVAHCGVRGHRGEHVMINMLRCEFGINNMQRHAQSFVRACLLCKHVKGAKLIQWGWTTGGVSTERNEVLVIYYLHLGERISGAKYCLVLKDAFTHFCELVATDSASSHLAADRVLSWTARFGSPKALLSDNGTHFRNPVLDQVLRALETVHMLSTVYVPWLNGGAERTNRGMLQVARVMLLEAKLDVRN